MSHRQYSHGHRSHQVTAHILSKDILCGLDVAVSIHLIKVYTSPNRYFQRIPSIIQCSCGGGFFIPFTSLNGSGFIFITVY